MPIKAAKSNMSAIETKTLRLPLLALEPRYVFDAALGSELTELAFDSATHTGDQADFSQQAADLVAAASDADASGEGHTADAADNGADHQVSMLVEATVTAHNLVRTNSEIVFIDSRLSGLPDIVSAVPEGSRIVLIDGASDAVSQITNALEQEQGVTGVHIISHGTPGSLQIGNTTLNAGTMSTIYRDALAGIRDNLAEGADILIYGCDFGAGEEGAQAAALLSELTGADIASSDDDTGSAELGGDWDLEQSVGSVETAGVFAPDYDGLLAPLVVTPVNGSSVTATTLAQTIMGNDVTIVSATLGGSNTQAGTFSSASGYTPSWLAFDSGVVFSSGAASTLTTSNTNDGNSSAGSSNVGTAGTAGFNTVGGGTSYDASYIDITFVPNNDRIALQFVFGSDEYNEYVYAAVNDAIGIWVNGTNIAVTPTGAAVGIDTINRAGTYTPQFGVLANDPNPSNGVFDSAAPSLFINNDPSDGTPAYSTSMDGFTRTLGATITVTPGVNNTIRIGVADIGDAVWNSWLLVKADSGQANLIAQNDSVGTTLNTPVTISPLANDIDFDDDSITITNIADQPVTAGSTVTLSSGATVLVNANGTLSFTPATGVTLPELFTYTITDGNGNTATAYITVNIVSGTAPTVDLDGSAAGTSYSTTYSPGGSAVAVSDVDTSVVDPDTNISSASIGISNAFAGDSLTVGTLPGGITVSPSSTSTNIVLTGNATAADYAAAIEAITYSNSLGSPDTTDRTVTVQVTDTSGLSSNVAVSTIDIFVNNPPNANDDAVNLNEDSGATIIDVLGNDSTAPDTGETLTVTAVTQPANGTVTLVGGVVSYTPNPNYFGTDTFTYTISDGNGGTDTATVTVNVANVNDNPDAVDDTVNVNEDSGATVINVLPNDGISPDTGETLTVTAVTQPANGTVTLVGGVVSYTPNPNYFGTDTFTYTISDGNGGTDTATVTVNVANVNDNPDAVDDTVNVNEDSGATVINVLPNDGISPDTGETLTVTAVTQPANGTVTLVGGVVSYTPNPNYFGTDTFTYTISDGNGGTDTATVTVNVANVNDNPDAVDDTVNVNEDSGATVINVLPNDGISPDTGETLTVTAVTQPANGTVTLVGGVVSYTPNPNYFGTDTFTYTISDGNGGTDTATVTVNVANVNDNPVDGDDTGSITEDTPLNVPAGSGLLSNASDTETDPLTVTEFTVGGTTYPVTPGTPGIAVIPGTGTLTINSDGSYSFTPAPNYTGAIPDVTYTVSDGQGGSDTSTLTLSIIAVNDAPDAANDTMPVTEDTPVSGNVLTNDTDIENDGLTVTEFQIGVTTYPAGTTATIPGVGTLVINPNGTYTFTPAANYNGPVPVATYTVSDGNGGIDTATLTLGPVVPANDAPVAVDDTQTATEDTPLSGNVLTNDTDVDNNPLTVTQFTIGGTTYPAGTTASIPGVGTLVINGDGTFTFTPAANYNGPVPVATYTVSDGNGGTDTGTLTLTVAPVNDAPVAAPDTTTTRFATPVVVNLTANDIDVENAPLTVKSASVPANQGALVNNGGVWTFIPAKGFTGAAMITYTITDDQGAESTSTHTVVVGLPPISAKNDKHIAAYNKAFTSSVASNDVYEKGAKFSVVKQPSGGTVVMRSDGTFKFTPKRGFSGVVTFTYRITDTYGQTVTAKETITVATEKHNCLVTFGKIKKK